MGCDLNKIQKAGIEWKEKPGYHVEKRILSEKNENVRVAIVYGEKKLTDCMERIICKHFREKKQTDTMEHEVLNTERRNADELHKK